MTNKSRDLNTLVIQARMDILQGAGISPMIAGYLTIIQREILLFYWIHWVGLIHPQTKALG